MKIFLIRLAFMLPVAVFITYLIIVLTGAIARLFLATNDFYCSTYCKLSIALIVFAVLVIVCRETSICWKRIFSANKQIEPERSI